MSLIEYHNSISKELIALTDRVRYLIKHWGEDGRYKEAVLKNVIKRFLPEKYLVGSGFVIKPTAVRGEHVSSKQIDLIVYDNESPILFRDGDFVIVTPDSVKAIIEVKANLQNANIVNVIKQANFNGQFIYTGKKNNDELLYNGIFSFSGYAGGNIDPLRDSIIAGNSFGADHDDFTKFRVNHISFNENLFLKYWPDEHLPNSLYDLQNLSFSFFISNLMDYLASESVTRNSFIWFANDKELNLIENF